MGSLQYKRKPELNKDFFTQDKKQQVMTTSIIGNENSSHVQNIIELKMVYIYIASYKLSLF